MPKFTIDLTQKIVDKLQQQVQRTNENAGANFTLTQWITVHLSEIAISEELSARIAALKQQQEADAQTSFNDAVTVARDELLGALE